ncbi:hypothetical protein TWF730_000638 [Orbilia blumenaviensis]|uniref:SprT-like domain-containing protein n=1 Tax=Orbilia blumenaviensis TaxID=1796055 RepID=A0AAV9VTB2_9PEZI
MVRLTVNQTTHEEWLAQNSMLSSDSTPSTELVQTDADDTTFFSCDEESIYESKLGNNQSRNKANVSKEILEIELSSDDEEADILPVDKLELELSSDDEEHNVLRAGNLEIELSSDDEGADILPADINDDSFTGKAPQVPHTPRAPTIDITSDDDSEDDDVIFGSRRTPFVLGTKRATSKEIPEIPIAIDEDSDKSDSEESDSSFAHSNNGDSDGSEFLPSPPPQKAKAPLTPFSVSSPTKLNRTTSKPVPAFLRRLQGIRQELPDDKVLEEIQPSPRKQRPRISLKRDPTLSVVSSIPSLSNDEIDTLSRELGDLAVDEDSVLEHTPNRFKRPPKIFQRTSSRIFDLSDSESDGESKEMEAPDTKKTNATPKPKPVTSMTPRTTSKSGKPLAPATIARLRKKEFEETKERIAKDYLKLLDDTVNEGAVGKLSAPTGGLQLVWTNSKQTTAGTCQTIRYGAGLGEEKTSAYFSCIITLESKVCDDVDRIKDTLAHEYTHACVDVLETDRKQVKSEGPHGRLFKTWAQKIGKAMNIDTPETCHNLEINYKFEYKCTLCDRIYKAHSRKPAWTSSKGCELCRVPLVQIKPVPRVAKGPTPYQTFQKETFAKLKQDLPPGTPFSLAKMQKEVNRLWKEEKSKNGAAGTAPKSLLESSESDNDQVETSLTRFENLIVIDD